MRLLRVLLTFWMLIGVAAMQAQEAKKNVGQEAYQKSLFKVVRANCVQCHGGKESTKEKAKAFAVENVETSYGHLKSYVRFDRPELSELVRRVQTEHWNSYLNEKDQRPDVTPKSITASIREWWDAGEKSVPGSNRPTTAARLLMEPPEKNPNAWVPMYWTLAKLTGEKSSYLEMETRRVGKAEGDSKMGYQFRRPRLVVAANSMRVADIRFVLNGNEYALANQFRKIDNVVAKQAIAKGENAIQPHPTLSGYFATVVQELKTGDEIAVSFGKLEPAETPKCRDLDSFRKNVMDHMVGHGCLDCHGNPERSKAPVGNQRFFVGGDPPANCLAVLQRGDPRNPRGSVFYLYGYQNAGGHPEVPLQDTAILADYTAWLQAETEAAKKK